MPGWAHDSFYQWGWGRAQTKTLPSAGDETPRRGQPRPEGAGVGGGSERCRRAAEGCWAGAPAEDAGVEGEGSPGVPHGLQDPQSACLPGPPHPVLCPRLRNPPEHGEGDRAVGGAHRGLRRVVPHPAHAHHHLRVRVEVLLLTGQGRGEGSGGGGERAVQALPRKGLTGVESHPFSHQGQPWGAGTQHPSSPASQLAAPVTPSSPPPRPPWWLLRGGCVALMAGAQVQARDARPACSCMALGPHHRSQGLAGAPRAHSPAEHPAP